MARAMTCRLLEAYSLPEPMLTYQQLDTKEPSSVNFEKKNA